MRKGIQFALCLLLPLSAGYLASMFTEPEMEGWYRQLQKPSWTPADQLFGRIWIALYLLMGVSLFIFLNKSRTAGQARVGIAVYLLQLLLNFGWPLIFFYLHAPGWALAELALLWISILLTILLFGRASKLAAGLLIPYLCWVSFAGYLNYTIWQLN